MSTSYRHARRAGRLVACVAALTVIGVVISPAAMAQDEYQSHAHSRFLSGTLVAGSVNLDSIAALGGVTADNDNQSTSVVQHDPLDLSALGSQVINVPGGVTLPLSGLLDLGAVNQYSEAAPNGVARAAAGAVADDGAVNTGGGGAFPANASFTLDKLLADTGLDGVIDDLSLNLRAITAVAAVDVAKGAAPATTCADLSAPVHCRDYNAAGGSLALHSPLIGQLVTQVLNSIGDVDDTLNGTGSAISTALKSLSALNVLPNTNFTVTTTVNSDLKDAVASVLDDTLSDNVVTVHLSTGTIDVDLDALLEEATGKGLNEQPPNTELLSAAVLADLTTHITTLLTALPTTVTNALNTALAAINVSISANACLLGTGTAPDCNVTANDGLGSGVDLHITGSLADLAAGTGTASATLQVLGATTPLDASSLLGAVKPTLATAVGAATTAINAAGTNVTGLLNQLEPVFDLIDQVLSIKANVQETGAGGPSASQVRSPSAADTTWREVAFRVTLLGAIGDGGLGTVDLGKAEVAAASGSVVPVDDSGMEPTPKPTPHPGPTSPTTLPDTGSSTSAWLEALAGFALLAGGLTLVLRRRPEAQ